MHIQTETEWQEEMAAKIIDFVRREIYVELRFLRLALFELTPRTDGNLRAFATDGRYLYLSPEWLIGIFKKNTPYLNRALLHTVLHCIFSHLWIGGNRERELWNLACDIAVEYTIDGLSVPCTKRILSWQRIHFYGKLRESGQGISAAVIYRILTGLASEELAALKKEFYTDDHCYWPNEKDGQARQEQAAVSQKRWNQLARQARLEQKKRGDEPEEGEELFFAQAKAEQSQRSYRDFLQRFSVFREELHADPEEFDLNYYTYGLRLYGSLPLIEPLETREVKKIREFAVAVDTSYSTSGGLVECFLKETFSVLTQKNSFFQESEIHVIQCDNQVRRDDVVRNEGDIDRLMAQFTVTGGGGTDFRPVFSYLEEQMEQGALKNLGGLLYFTDGKGIYPKKRPGYKTAFLFLEDYDETAVPPWAIRLRLSQEEFFVPEERKKIGK